MSKLQIIRRLRWVFTKHRTITITGVPPTTFPCRMLGEDENLDDLLDGDTVYLSIAYIVENFRSSDGGRPGDWEAIWRMKSGARHFAYIKATIAENGFVVPLDLERNVYGKQVEWEFGNGHHRLTASRELGLTHVPVRVNPSWDETCAKNIFVSDPKLNEYAGRGY